MRVGAIYPETPRPASGCATDPDPRIQADDRLEYAVATYKSATCNDLSIGGVAGCRNFVTN